jgi:flagellin
MSLGTQTITDRSATTSTVDISSAIASAIAITGATVTSVYNATFDAINSNQKLSFAAKTDALGTIQTLFNAYNNSAVIGNTAANFATDATAVLSQTNPATQVNLLISSVGVLGDIFQADAFGSTAKFIKFANASALVALVGATANGTSAGQLGATQTASSGQNNAQAAINAIDNALTEVNTISAVQGALQNRFTAVISNLSAFSQSQTAAKSRIVDADFAAETAQLSKNQILQQAGTAMLAQANQIPSTVLSLLK